MSEQSPTIATANDHEPKKLKNDAKMRGDKCIVILSDIIETTDGLADSLKIKIKTGLTQVPTDVDFYINNNETVKKGFELLLQAVAKASQSNGNVNKIHLKTRNTRSNKLPMFMGPYLVALTLNAKTKISDILTQSKSNLTTNLDSNSNSNTSSNSSQDTVTTVNNGSIANSEDSNFSTDIESFLTKIIATYTLRIMNVTIHKKTKLVKQTLYRTSNFSFYKDLIRPQINPTCDIAVDAKIFEATSTPNCNQSQTRRPKTVQLEVVKHKIEQKLKELANPVTCSSDVKIENVKIESNINCNSGVNCYTLPPPLKRRRIINSNSNLHWNSSSNNCNNNNNYTNYNRNYNIDGLGNFGYNFNRPIFNGGTVASACCKPVWTVDELMTVSNALSAMISKPMNTTTPAMRQQQQHSQPLLINSANMFNIQLPNYNNISNMQPFPRVSNISGNNTRNHAPSVPTIPNISNISNLPNIQNVQNLPNLLSLPSMSSMSSMSSMPSMSSVSMFGNIPSFPNLPNINAYGINGSLNNNNNNNNKTIIGGIGSVDCIGGLSNINSLGSSGRFVESMRNSVPAPQTRVQQTQQIAQHNTLNIVPNISNIKTERIEINPLNTAFTSFNYKMNDTNDIAGNNATMQINNVNSLLTQAKSNCNANSTATKRIKQEPA